jgi:hypothetical protein
MRSRRMGLLAVAAGCALAGLVADVGATTAPAVASLTPVSSANSKSPGIAAPNVLSKELQEVVAAQGSFKLENPDPAVGSYGYDSNGPFVPLPAAPTTEASKTEPDKNTYLVIKGGLAGADPGYTYGTHFLFQGHEGGTIGYLTRINLDADGAHRVTLLATRDVTGAALPVFDGSTWNPFAGRLLFSAERGSSGGIWDRAGPGDVSSHGATP